jgi:cytochrome c-type biogenesis protein CcmH/NrfG
MKLFIIYLLSFTIHINSQEAVKSYDTKALQQYYDSAFKYYLEKDYKKAIEQWNMVLKIDPTQITAKNMIEQAREKLGKSSAEGKSKFYSLVDNGNYKEALLKVEEMLVEDAENPLFLKFQKKLKKITSVITKKPQNTKAWKIAVLGLSHYINENEDLNFAYDALRYSSELSPQDSRFQSLISILEEEEPGLKLNDTKPPNISIIEHKKNIALHYIYDSKFYLAIKELQSVLKLEPEDIVSLKRLGSAYLQLKDYERARDCWEKALKISPEDEQLKEYLQALDKVSQSNPSPKEKKKRRNKKTTSE